MAVRFLTEEWAAAVTDTLNSSEDFRAAAGSHGARLQFVATDVPGGGEAKYYFKLEDGKAVMDLGELADAEATITNTYATAVAVDKGELNPQNAFMQGKLRISGNMMKLLQLQGVLSAMAKAIKGLERDYAPV